MKLKPYGLILFAAGLVIAGGMLLVQALNQRVTFLIDGKTSTRQVYGLTVADALQAVHIALAPGDRLAPPSGSYLWGLPDIRIVRASGVTILAGQQDYALTTSEKIVANLLELAGLRLYPGDQVLYQGAPVSPGLALSPSNGYVLQLIKAVPITVVDLGHSTGFYSSAPTLGQALWQQGIRLDPLDQAEPGLDTSLDHPVTVTIHHPASLVITLGGQSIMLKSSAVTIGQALRQAGIVLVGLDYSVPGDTQPLPSDGLIRVVRVRETVALDQKNSPFSTTTQADPQTELDQRSVIQAGQTGLMVSRTRIRYEDNKEVSRILDGEWLVRAARPRILGYGTKIVVHTSAVDGATISYYRAVTVYATSYSPCDSGSCSYYTASGAKVERGVVGVSPAWYNLLKGQRVYIPGYGAATIADYGDVGSYRVDLGYSDSDFVGWHKNVTLYFLAPAPASVPWILP